MSFNWNSLINLVPGGKTINVILIIIAAIIIGLVFLHVIPPDSAPEELAEEIIKQETGVDVQLNKK